MAIKTHSQKPGLIPIIVTVALSVGIVIALWVAGSRQMTPTESVLLGILLTAASMLVSWLATHLYSQVSLKDAVAHATEANTENIRNLGVRAAEKVLNLSNELERLSDALTTALDDATDMEGTKQPVTVLRERMLSAIHNLETLKSMNDTFLSDWRGVIGEEIERQQALEKQIELLTEELKNQIRERNLLRTGMVSPEDLSVIQSRIEETENRLTEKIANLPFRVSTASSKPKAENVRVKCPSCGMDVNFRIRLRNGAKKLIRCEKCSTHSHVTVLDDGEFELHQVPMHEFIETCPLCTTSVESKVPDYPGAMVSLNCAKCDVSLLASRSATGVNLRIPKGSSKQVPTRILDMVRERLPKRPWPTYIHKSIANDLNLSNGVVSNAIGRLIEQGFFPLPAPRGSQDATEQSHALEAAVGPVSNGEPSPPAQ